MREFAVYQLCVLGYSGSSLMNMLLDSVLGFRGLGEIDRWHSQDPARPCIQCTPQDCGFYESVRKDYLYQDIARCYPEAKALVDSSKKSEFYQARRDEEPELDYRQILLWKTPHAYLHSWTGHVDPKYQPVTAWKMWGRYYAEVAAQASPQLRYEELTVDPVAALTKVLGELPLFRRPTWWQTDTHVIGGNTSIRAVLNEHTSSKSNLFTAERLPQDRPNKYRGRAGEIFLDDAWRKDRAFQELADGLYAKFGHEVAPALELLGSSVEAMREELWQGAPVADAERERQFLRAYWTAPDLQTAKDTKITVPANPSSWCDEVQDSIARTVLRKVKWEGRDLTALDFGAGVGRVARAVARLGLRVYAVDVSEEMLRFAREYCGEELDVTYVLTDGYGCGSVPDRSVDYAYSYYTFQHMRSWEMIRGCLRDLDRVVKPGGVILLQSWQNPRPDSNPEAGVYQTQELYEAAGRALGWRLNETRRLDGGATFELIWNQT